jgi:hypothetical protein
MNPAALQKYVSEKARAAPQIRGFFVPEAYSTAPSKIEQQAIEVHR